MKPSQRPGSVFFAPLATSYPLGLPEEEIPQGPPDEPISQAQIEGRPHKFSSPSKQQNKETPDHIFQALDKEWGPFTVDAAASESNAKCDLFYDEELDGLLQDYSGQSVWCNPPYNNIAAWLEVARESSVLPSGASWGLLLPSRTDTAWFHEYLWWEKRGCPRMWVRLKFLSPRVEFLDEDKKKGPGNTEGSIFAFFVPRPRNWRELSEQPVNWKELGL